MKTLLIVYHSRTGGAEQMARAAMIGARTDSDARLLRAEETGPGDLLAADGFLFVAPENLAALSGAMKDFFDRCYYPVLGKLEGRPYGLMICAGSDGENAVRQTARIATGWRLKQVHAPLIILTDAQTPAEILAPKRLGAADLQACQEIGETLAAGLSMGIF
jgi:flavodoxin